MENDLNVADLMTRECSSVELDEGSMWQKGPRFLSYPTEEWPIQSSTSVTRLPQIKKNFVGTVATEPATNSIASAIDISRFSKFRRLLNSEALCQIQR